MSTTTTHDHAAAWVGEVPLNTSEVDAALARLRTGTRAALLPVADSPEGRQLRRWVTQTLVTTRLLEDEASRIPPSPPPPLAEIVPDRLAALQLGGVLASVLAESPSARRVFARVSAGCAVAPEEVTAYRRRNLDLFADAAGVELPLDEVVPTITALLLSAARRRRFIDWLDDAAASRTRLEPGYEHPGDPRQPDSTHRH